MRRLLAWLSRRQSRSEIELKVSKTKKKMKQASLNSSPALHCVVSAIAIFGSFAAWYTWVGVGGAGWQGQHWGQGVLWAGSAIIGLWAAVDALRLLWRKRGWQANLMALVTAGCAIFHLLSLLLLWNFINILMEGGPRA